MAFKHTGRLVTVAALSTLAWNGAQAQTLFSGGGGDAALTLQQFRTAIGGVDNGGAAPATKDALKGKGRREINWDAVKLDGTDFGGNTTVIDPGHTINIPINRFQARGTLFEEPYAVSGDGFATVNPGMAGQFVAFSPKNTFAMANENNIEMSFVFASNPASAAAQAGSRGFGAIFSDVELANTSSIEYFNGSTSLGKFFVPVGKNGESEFLGVLFDQPVVTSVKLTLGNANLFDFDGHAFTPGSPENLAQGIDLAVTDDFVFAEPTQAVPEPSAALLTLTGIGTTALVLQRRKRR